MKYWKINDAHTLTLTESNSPTPNTDQVRVSVKACGINRADILQVAGKYPPPQALTLHAPASNTLGLLMP